MAKEADFSDGTGGEQDWRGLRSQESACPVHQQAGEPLAIVPMTFSSLCSWRRGWEQRPWSPVTQGLVDALDANDSKSRIMDAKGLGAGGAWGGQGWATLDVLGGSGTLVYSQPPMLGHLKGLTSGSKTVMCPL